MKGPNLTLFLTLLSTLCLGQGFKFVKSIEILPHDKVSIDRGGRIYLSTFNGDIIRYDADLSNELVFSPQNPNRTDNLEAWQGLRIFTFHKDLQEFRLINRNLSLDERYLFPNNLVGFAEIATSTFDNNVWLIDQTEFSLKKYDIFKQSLQTSTPLNLILDVDDYEILHCKEYQNRFFISTKNRGILIFDNLGNYLKNISINEVENFNFWKDELYFISKTKIKKVDLYSNNVTEFDLPQGLYRDVLIYDNSFYFFKDKSLSLFTLVH